MDIDTIVQDVVEGKISLREALTSQEKQSEKHLLAHNYLNKHVFVRTATHYHVGKLVLVADGFLELEYASWIPDTGRFHEFLREGSYSEAEPFSENVCISIGAIIDICKWNHNLPTEAK